MRALVTGSCGFVGDYLAKHLLESGDEVLGTRLSDPVLACPYTTVTLDITDTAKLRRVIADFRPHAIYHLAGMAFVPEAETNFQRALSVNVGGVESLFRVCHELDCGITILLVSSAEVYGRIKGEQLPITENFVVQPANNYSLTKAMAEQVVHRFTQFGQVKSVIVRPFNHIGPRQDKRFVASTFAYQLSEIARGRAEPVIRVGNLEARRDFTDVRDVVRAYRLAVSHPGRLYNICCGSAYPIQSILDTLIEVSGLKVSIEPDPSRMRAAEVPEIRGSYARAKAELGWSPGIDLRTTLKDTYQYFLTN